MYDSDHIVVSFYLLTGLTCLKGLGSLLSLIGLGGIRINVRATAAAFL